MPDKKLRRCRILVVEDEYLLAQDLRTELEEFDVIVLGPVGSVADAISLINAEERIDGAVLDVNLRGELVFPAAALLKGRGVPFVFATGYDGSVIPDEFCDAPRCEKPINANFIIREISRLIHA